MCFWKVKYELNITHCVYAQRVFHLERTQTPSFLRTAYSLHSTQLDSQNSCDSL